VAETLAESVLRCVRAAGDTVEPKHQALVDLAVRYALQIDAGINEGGQAATKALYLGPHLVNALAALDLVPNPDALNQKKKKKAAAAPVEDELSALRNRHRGGA